MPKSDESNLDNDPERDGGERGYSRNLDASILFKIKKKYTRKYISFDVDATLD
jgi:hypothetical protein